jgi:hypothetical protein
MHEAVAIRADQAEIGLRCVANAFIERIRVMHIEKRARFDRGVHNLACRIEPAIVASELAVTGAAPDETIRKQPAGAAALRAMFPHPRATVSAPLGDIRLLI